MSDLIPVTYQYKSEFESHDIHAVLFQRMRSPFYEGEKWSVRQGSFCLTKKGHWEHEPIPSNRDKKFYDRCRFDSLEAAQSTYESSVAP